MAQSYLERVRARLQNTRRGTMGVIGGVVGNSETHGKAKGRRRLSLVIVLAVLACMVLTVAGNMYRNRSANSATSLATTTHVEDAYGNRAAPQAAMENTTNQPQKLPGLSGQQPPTTGGAGKSVDQQPAAGQAAQQQPNWDRMIVRTATLQLKVKDVAASLDKARALAGEHGGYVSASDSHIESDYTVATLTIQVPARQFDDAMTDLRKIGLKPLGENVSSSDVTEEFTDLQSQLRNLQATEGRISALMAKAEKIEDILSLDRELRQIQSEIERIQGRLTYLSKRSEMSSITLSLYPEVAPVEPLSVKTDEGWNPGKVVQEAWNASLQMLSGIATVALTITVFMWWAIPLLLLAFWLVVRPRRNGTTAPTPDAA